MLRLLVLFLFLSQTYAISYAQREDITKLIASIQKLQHHAPDSALDYSKRALALAQREEDQGSILTIYALLAELQTDNQQIKEAKQTLQKGLSLALSLDKPSWVSKFHALHNYYYRMTHNPDTAFLYSKKAIDYLESKNMEVAQLKHLNDIGETLRGSLLREKAILYLTQAIEMGSAISLSPLQLPRSYNRLGAVYNEYSHEFSGEKRQEFLEKAVNSLESSLKVSDQLLEKEKNKLTIRFLQDVKANSYNELANIYTTTGYNQKGITYAEKALEMRLEIGYIPDIIGSSLALNNLYIREKEYDKALLFLESKIQPLVTTVRYKIPITENLIRIYREKGEYKKALTLWEELERHRHAFRLTKNEKKLIQASTKYEVERVKQQAILAQAELKNQQLERYLILLGLLITTIFAGFLWYNYRKIRSQAKKLIRLDRFKQRMTDMIVHDLKNPLNTVIGYTQQTSLQVSQIRNINQAGLQMLTLVENMLDVQKFEEEQITLQEATFSTFDLLKNAVRQVEVLVKRKNLSIDYDIPSTLPSLKGDFRLLERVLVNVLTNAIKHSSSGSRLVLMLRSQDSIMKFSVQDFGKGIPELYLNKIFERFGQVSTEGSGQTGSTGLGLTFCKFAVEAHRGKIGVHSKVNEGSTFWFTIPFKEDADQNQSTLPSRVVASDIKLSANDQKDLLPYLRNLQEYEVYEASRVLDILEKVPIDKPSLRKWKDELEESIFRCDNEKYKALVELSVERI